MFLEFALLLAFGALILASWEDLKTGEIADWKSTGFAAAVVVLALVNTVISWDYQILLTTLLWAAAYLAFSVVLFYLGQWGGGDVKMMAALGACMGYIDSIGFGWPESSIFGHQLHPLLSFLINMAFISVPYAIVYTVMLGVGKPQAFTQYFKRLGERKVIAALALMFMPSIAASYFGLLEMASLYLFLPLFYLASVYMKTVEHTVLRKTIAVAKLKPWDILSEDLRVGGRLIATRRNIEGVTPEQVAEIKKLSKAGKIPKTIDIRWGVKFLPVIALSFLATLYVGDALAVAFAFLTRT